MAAAGARRRPARLHTLVQRAEEFKTFRSETGSPRHAGRAASGQTSRATTRRTGPTARRSRRKSTWSSTRTLPRFRRSPRILRLQALDRADRPCNGSARHAGRDRRRLLYCDQSPQPPILDLTGKMKLLPAAISSVDVPFAGRKDEIGDMRRRSKSSRQNSIAVRELNAQEEVLREKSADLQSSIATVVAAAAAGDFTRRIGKDYDNDRSQPLCGERQTNWSTAVDTGIAETRRSLRAWRRADLTQSMKGQSRAPSPSCRRTSTIPCRPCRRPLREVA